MSIERWALSKSELENPQLLNSWDELLAPIHPGIEFRDVPEGSGVIVYRNGSVSNRWIDGTAGISDEVFRWADSVETLYHPNADEATYLWADVEVDEKGNFVKFAKGNNKDNPCPHEHLEG